MGRVHMPPNGGFFLPMWFRRDTARAKDKLAAGEITKAEYDEEMAILYNEYDCQQAEFRAGRG